MDLGHWGWYRGRILLDSEKELWHTREWHELGIERQIGCY